jgi:hypothetical protein
MVAEPISDPCSPTLHNEVPCTIAECGAFVNGMNVARR